MSEQPYLLDALETADMLVIDDLHAFDFQLDAAAEAGEPFASESAVLHIQAQDGRERKHWQFSYNAVMEAEYQSGDDSWLIDGHRLICLAAVSAETD